MKLQLHMRIKLFKAFPRPAVAKVARQVLCRDANATDPDRHSKLRF